MRVSAAGAPRAGGCRWLRLMQAGGSAGTYTRYGRFGRVFAALLLTVAQTMAASLQEEPVASESSQRWALVIGISNYAKAEPLKYAATDARSLAGFLNSPRGGAVPVEQTFVYLENQASRFQILVDLEEMGRRVRPGDTAYVFLAGHGYVTERGIGYFLPSDVDLRYLGATAVPFSHLKELVEQNLAHAANRILITDMCYAGRVDSQTSELALKIQNLVNQEIMSLSSEGGSFLNLLASGPTEPSWELDSFGRGVFTQKLLEALDGLSVGPGQSVVTAADLVRFVREEVPRFTANQQHPRVNTDFKPELKLAFLNLPGPEPQVLEAGSVLVLANAEKSTFSRVQWTDPKTDIPSVRQLSKDGGKNEIGSLLPGPLELRLFKPDDESQTVLVQLDPGRNSLDLEASELGLSRSLSPELMQIASLSPPPLRHLFPALEQSPALAGEGTEASLLLRIDEGTQVFLDDDYFGAGQTERGFMQLKGLRPGEHQLRLLPSPDREQRFRLQLFSGPHLFEAASAELRPLSGIALPPSRLPSPAAISPALQETYRNLLQALWEERLVTPGGDSAWDYFQQIEGALPEPLRDTLRRQTTVAMGDRAQRIMLKYISGVDVKWNAEIFEEGALLMTRFQSLFRPGDSFESFRRFFLGRAALERGDHTLAERELRESIQLDAEAAYAYNGLGLNYWKQGSLQRAVPPLQEAVRLAPRWTYPRVTLALIQLEERLYQQAEQTLQQILQDGSQDSTVFRSLGQLYLLQERYGESESRLLESIRLDPGNAYAYETLGRLQQRRQSFEQAEQSYRLAIRLQHQEPSFRLRLAQLLRQIGRNQEAGSIFNRVAADHPLNSQLLLSFSAFLAAQDRLGEARALFDRALASLPDDANLRISYGVFLLEQGLYRQAAKEFKKSVRLAAESPFAHYNLAEAYLYQRKAPAAEKELRLAAQLDPRYPKPPMLLGRIRLEQKRFEAALTELQKARELSIEAAQKDELDEYLSQARQGISANRLEEARRFEGKKKYAQAWSILARALQSAPQDKLIREAVLSFQAKHPGQADLQLLPPSPTTEALLTAFWMEERRAEGLWRDGKRGEALKASLQSFRGLDAEQRRLVAATAFNLGNDQYGIHQLVYKWGRRMMAEGDYSRLLELMTAAIDQHIFGIVPGLSPLTIDSLMIPADVAEPRRFEDFEVAHHPDRRAHELLAAAQAAKGDIDRARQYLPALEVEGADIAARVEIARVLRRRGKWAQAALFLEEALARLPTQSPDTALLEEAFLICADSQCASGMCPSGIETLRRGLSILPKSKKIKADLKKLRAAQK